MTSLDEANPWDTHHVHHWISLQGSIGAGKSTLLKLLRDELIERRLLATRLDAWGDGRPLFVIVDEPVDEWNVKKYGPDGSHSILELFYSDQKEYAFVFQVEAFTSRLNNLTRALANLPVRQSKPPIHLVSERSLRTDALFFRNLWLAGQVKPVEYDTYQRFFDKIAAPLLKRETVMIHVPTKPQECHRRIAKRARDGESAGVTLEYLETLEQAHLDMVSDFTGQVFTMNEFHQDLRESQMQYCARQLLNDLIDCCRT